MIAKINDFLDVHCSNRSVNVAAEIYVKQLLQQDTNPPYRGALPGEGIATL